MTYKYVHHQFELVARQVGINLLSHDLPNLIAFANIVSAQSRDATIEVCARIAENCASPNPDIAAAIRGLKPTKEPS